MSTALATLAGKLAERVGMDSVDPQELITTLRQTAFKGDASDAQFIALLIVANQYGLNPWTKEIYAFPDKQNGIVPVVGVDGWSRIINENQQFDGMDFEQDNESCTCRIYRKDRNHPICVTEWMDECRREPFKTREGSEIDIFKQRALNYKNVYHPKRKLMVGKDDKGVFNPKFDAVDWSGEFCEGNSWHWSFCVFHDPQGLINLMGGKKEFNAMMDSVFVIPGKQGMESRGMIHEMREMQVMNMGQYAHGNQPIQHMVYLYNYSSEPWKAQYWIREIMNKLYTAGPDGYCGDEDNGQTSAWYVFSALGFYPVCPGTDEYIIGTPLFKSAKLHLENGKTITIKADNNQLDNRYIKEMKVNGKSQTRNFLTHDQLIKGANIQFQMSPVPNKQRGTTEKDVPYSLSFE